LSNEVKGPGNSRPSFSEKLDQNPSETRAANATRLDRRTTGLRRRATDEATALTIIAGVIATT